MNGFDKLQALNSSKAASIFFCLGEPDMDWEYWKNEAGAMYFKNIITGDHIIIKGNPIDLEIGQRVKIDYFPE